MDDTQIIALYFARSEQAIEETAKKYGAYCRSIAGRILQFQEDCEECVNDVFFRAWNNIPPGKPENLGTYLGKITRNLAIDRREQMDAAKRGGGQIPLILDELAECVGSGGVIEDELALAQLLNGFLASLPREPRQAFLLRYWYALPVREISQRLRVSEGKVKMSLMRTRNLLKKVLEKEGITV